MTEDGTVLARIAPSRARRWMATGVLVVLGALLVLLGFLRPPASLPLAGFLVGLGVAALLLALRLHAATGRGLVLTGAGLRDTDGREIARMDDVVGVERGLLAAKPSNGFLLRLATPQPRAWAPGLWWRAGRRVGVGGAISGGEGRAMADAIAAMVAARAR